MSRALEQELRCAEQQVNQDLAHALATGDFRAFRASTQTVFELERKLAVSRGESYAESIRLPFEWLDGAPCPHVLTFNRRVALVFAADGQVDEAVEAGTSIRVIDPALEESLDLGVVEFRGVLDVRMGPPSHDNYDSHPLFGKCLEPGRAQEVHSSPWIDACRKLGSENVDRLRHLAFWMHDESFECLAETYEVERVHGTFKDVMKGICDRFLAYDPGQDARDA